MLTCQNVVTVFVKAIVQVNGPQQQRGSRRGWAVSTQRQLTRETTFRTSQCLQLRGGRIQCREYLLSSVSAPSWRSRKDRVL